MSGRVGVEQTPDIEAVLAEHVDVGPMLSESEGYTKYVCLCGEGSNDYTWHRAHVAQALAPVLAAAVREARAAELREAADEAAAMDYPSSQDPVHWAIWLRYRADRIAVDAPEGGEGR
jgi:hypothetical protein